LWPPLRLAKPATFRNSDDNLIVAAYDIQWVGQKWHDHDKLAEVIQHFDVGGIIEIKKEKSLPDLAKQLKQKTGQDWGFIYGVRTHLPPSSDHEASCKEPRCRKKSRA